jgi:PAS domain S-box-containing protein
VRAVFSHGNKTGSLLIFILIGAVGFRGDASATEVRNEPCHCFFQWHDEWRWSHFGMDDGLPSSLISSLVESPDGTVWVGTDSGAAYFDGFGFVLLGISDGIPDVKIQSLAIDDSGDVYMVAGDRAYRGGRDGFVEISLEDSWENGRALGLVRHATGEGVVVLRQHSTMADRSLLHITQTSAERLTLPSGVQLAGDHPEGGPLIFEVPGINVFRMAGASWSWDGSEWQQVLLDGSPIASRLRPVGSRELRLFLVENDRGVHDVWKWITPDNTKRVDFDSVEMVHAAAVWPNGDSLLVYGSGAVRYRIGDTWSLAARTPRFFQSARSALVDHRDNLWLGTENGLHLFRCQDSLWSYWNHEVGNPRNWINSLAPAGDGGVWIGTNDGVAYRDQSGETKMVSQPKRFPVVTATREDSKGRLWIGSGLTFGGSYVYWKGSWNRFETKSSFDMSRIHAIEKDRRGRLWFLGLDRRMPGDSEKEYTGPGGVFILNEHDQIVEWPEWDQSSPTRIYSFCEGADGSYWFGTLHGLRCWKDGVWHHFRPSNEDEMFKVSCLALEPDGRMWFGTHSGEIGCVDSDLNMSTIEIPSHLGVGQIWAMAFDSSGGLWATTTNGLLRCLDGEWFRLGFESGLMHSKLWPILFHDDSLFIGTGGQGLGELNGLTKARPSPQISVDVTVSDDDLLVRWRPLAHLGRLPPSVIPTRIRLEEGAWSDWSTSRNALFSEQSIGRHQVEVQAFDLLAQKAIGSNVEEFVIGAPREGGRYLLAIVVGLLLVLGTVIVVLVRRRSALNTELKVHRERLQSILDYTTAVIYVKGLDGRYLLTNRRFNDLFHKKHGEMIGIRDEDWLPGEVAASVKENDRRVVAADSPLEFEEEVPSDGQLHRYISLKFPLRDEWGNVNAVCGISTDITIMHQQAEALEQARDAADRANRAKSVFLANVSHELRTPITALLSAAELLGRGSQDPESRSRCLSILMRNSEHLGLLVNDLLDLSRTEADSLKVNIVSHSLLEILEGLSAMCSALGNRSDSQLEFIAETPLPALLVTDGTRLKQAIYNLIDNAMKYTPKGNVLVRFRCEQTDGPLRLCVSVEDNGKGIAESDLERIFEPFTQLDDRSRDVVGGIGVGLPLARNIVRQLGGTLTAGHRNGGGSVFDLTVPVGREEIDQWIDADEVFSAHDVSMPTAADEEKLRGRVLLAEDYDDTREMIRVALECKGVDIVAVENGEKAVEAVRAGDFDLILMDDRMPGMTGREAVRRLRANGCLSTVIAITATTEEADRRQLLDAGFDDLWPKPIRIGEILARIKDYLDSEQPDSDEVPKSNKSNSNSSLFDRLRRDFAAGLGRRMELLNAHCAESNTKEIREFLHQLAGSAGIHGFDELSREAVRLEAEVRKEPDRIRSESFATLMRLAGEAERSVKGTGLADAEMP